MLAIKNISKTYQTGDFIQVALNDVSLNFRSNEFVSILGPSGSGKTTLLNIVGGLDTYDSGDLLINGISTQNYKDRDWDAYRNHSIGFVFQSYNLIPHQSVCANVELALTISGISKAKRRDMALQALDDVGLKAHAHKKPSQLSGGQMQRVAIARALVNDPDILLADEPTGALDSETSEQVMNLLQNVAKHKLVIMVTHNDELAHLYSNRIVRLKDGVILDDSNPFAMQEIEKSEANPKRASMNFMTALNLSFNNLKTKKARTILTSFAGSIGIIGIALILSLSNGVNTYITKVQEDTLSSFPLQIESEAMDMTSMLTTFMETSDTETIDNPQKVYSNNVASKMMQSVAAQQKKNDLATFKEHLDQDQELLSKVSGIQYRYDVPMFIYDANTQDSLVQVYPSELVEMGPQSDQSNFSELLPNPKLLEAQYDVVAGRMPDVDKPEEIVLVTDEHQQISDVSLYMLNILDQKDYKAMEERAQKGETIEAEPMHEFDYDSLLNKEYRVISNAARYQKDAASQKWLDKHDDNIVMRDIVNQGLSLRIVGVIKPNPEASAHAINSTIGYNAALTEYLMNDIQEASITKEQQADPNWNVFTQEAFEEHNKSLTRAEIDLWIQTLSAQEQQQFQAVTQSMSDEQVIAMVEAQLKDDDSLPKTYEESLKEIGYLEKDTPSAIAIYPKDFASKDEVVAFIDTYNADKKANNEEALIITYTDFAGLMMSSISTIINMITYVLVGFISISLIVSSIMIGIITYISVLERTKEIGILRSIGASKRNITRIFNAETLIVGLFSGLLGIGITLLLLIPANAIIEALSGVANIAKLPWIGAMVLIVLSIFLSMLAGLIPSKKAAKQDPVTALRSE